MGGADVRPTRTAFAASKKPSEPHAVQVAADRGGVVAGGFDVHQEPLGSVVAGEPGHVRERVPAQVAQRLDAAADQPALASTSPVAVQPGPPARRVQDSGRRTSGGRGSRLKPRAR